MLNREELIWLKKSTNELNNLLQEISASAYRIDNLSHSIPEIRQYLAITVQSVERATRVTDSILNRIRESETVIEKVSGGETLTRTRYGNFHVVSEHSPASPHSPLPPSPPISMSGGEDPATVAQEYGLTLANPQGEKELILMVDDEESVLLLARMMLTDAGYRVITAPKPLKALELYKRIHNHVSLVILDFAMPVMDGSELFDSLRLANPKLVAVLSSGFADQSKISRMLSKGLKGFIPKPYTPEKLLTQIRSLLDLEKRRTLVH